ncbi:SAICAR synthase-like protein [Pholiota conissans]|uniref:Kinase n=1 Tax=Pholiota conissans TaxID=109636 RepID=A0A9P6D1X1_9AGAR|nr:SAICAR synthase-like protein [Pholiota conissans]
MDTHTTHALESQVGGHAGVMTTEDGSLIIKPALARELEFYQALQSHDMLAAFRPFTPKFLGVLKLQGQVDPAHGDALESLVNLQPVAEQKDELLFLESIVLENLSFGFSKPNILDVKLGTVLHDEDAPPDKVERMLKTARETTSFETGIRLTGFQVYDNITSKPINTPKSYGKSIKPSELAEGLARFFPVGSPIPALLSESDGTPSHGLPRDTLIPLLKAIRSEIAMIREILASVEMRMVGGSLLIIYEADWEKAAVSIQKHLERQEEATRRREVGVMKNAYEDEDENDEDEDEEDEDEDEEDEDGPPKLGPPFIVKLIDFAHTRLKPGYGPDVGVLRGVDTVLNLLDTRLESVLSF